MRLVRSRKYPPTYWRRKKNLPHTLSSPAQYTQRSDRLRRCCHFRRETSFAAGHHGYPVYKDTSGMLTVVSHINTAARQSFNLWLNLGTEKLDWQEETGRS